MHKNSFKLIEFELEMPVLLQHFFLTNRAGTQAFQRSIFTHGTKWNIVKRPHYQDVPFLTYHHIFISS